MEAEERRSRFFPLPNQSLHRLKAPVQLSDDSPPSFFVIPHSPLVRPFVLLKCFPPRLYVDAPDVKPATRTMKLKLPGLRVSVGAWEDNRYKWRGRDEDGVRGGRHCGYSCLDVNSKGQESAINICLARLLLLSFLADLHHLLVLQLDPLFPPPPPPNPTTLARVPIDSIPPEVVSHIVGLVSPFFSEGNRADLRSLALVSRAWCSPAQQRLAVDVEVSDWSAAKAFLQGFPRTKADGTSRRVRSLTFNTSWDGRGSLADIHRIWPIAAVAVLALARPTECLCLGTFVNLNIEMLRLPSVQGERRFLMKHPSRAELTFVRRHDQTSTRSRSVPGPSSSTRTTTTKPITGRESSFDSTVSSSMSTSNIGTLRNCPPMEFFRNVVVGSGRGLVSLDLIGYNIENDVATAIFDQLAPQLTSLALSPYTNDPSMGWATRRRLPHAVILWSPLSRCKELKTLVLSEFDIEEVSSNLSVVPASLVVLELRKWESDALAANTPPILAFLDVPSLKGLKRWHIESLSKIETTSGAGAEWKARCEERGIELRDGAEFFFTGKFFSFVEKSHTLCSCTVVLSQISPSNRETEVSTVSRPTSRSPHD